MKKIFISLAVILISLSIFSQSTDKISYQAVIRDNNNQLVQNSTIGIKISILQGSESGTVVYEEEQTPVTNSNGLISIQIGNLTRDFNDIDWAAGTHFIKTEVDPAGGTNYTITGTSQMLSVPYALHAKTAESLSGAGESHYVGELYGGGVVFWVDHTGQHGLVVSMIDVVSYADALLWSSVVNAPSGGGSFWDGRANSEALVAQEGHTDSHAKRCLDYTNSDYGTGTFSDWYMPSIGEMLKLINNIGLVQNALDTDGDPNTVPFLGDKNLYTSTELGANRFYVIAGSLASAAITKGNSTACTRAVRAF